MCTLRDNPNIVLQQAAQVADEERVRQIEEQAGEIETLRGKLEKVHRAHLVRERQHGALQKEAKAAKQEAEAQARKQLNLYERLTGAKPRLHLASDRRVMDVIDAYQTKIRTVTAELADARSTLARYIAGDTEVVAAAAAAAVPAFSDVAPARDTVGGMNDVRIKAVQRSKQLDRELLEAKERLESFEMELSARPTISQWRSARQKIVTLEKKCKVRTM